MTHHRPLHRSFTLVLPGSVLEKNSENSLQCVQSTYLGLDYEGYSLKYGCYKFPMGLQFYSNIILHSLAVVLLSALGNL